MATKLFKKTNHMDVFAAVLEEDDQAAVLEEDDQAAVLEEDDHASIVADDEKKDDKTDHAVLEVNGSCEPQLEDEDDSSEESKEAPATSPRRRWVRRVLVGAVAVIFVAALALSGFLGWQVKQQHDIRNAGRAAMATAQSYTVALTSIDTNNVDSNFDTVLNGATGEFKDMYSQSASQLRQVLIDNKAMSKGIVVDSAIKSATKTTVEVLIFIDQSITNSVNPEPRIDRSRVAMTMELIDGRWLASKVDIK